MHNLGTTPGMTTMTHNLGTTPLVLVSLVLPVILPVLVLLLATTMTPTTVPSTPDVVMMHNLGMTPGMTTMTHNLGTTPLVLVSLVFPVTLPVLVLLLATTMT